MPRTSTKLGNFASGRSSERAIRVEKMNWWQATKHFFMARETRMIIGILLLTLAVVALLSYISFLFTGTNDQSVLALDHAERIAQNHLPSGSDEVALQSPYSADMRKYLLSESSAPAAG